MPLWMSLLALASVSGQFATAPKPVISLQPPWTTAFQGESVLLTCNEFPINSPRETTWFYQNQGSQTSSTTPGNTRVVQETGKYQCQHNGSSLSGSVHLIFSSAALILQAPLSVFEGDTMVLRCLRRPGSALKTTTIYKNWEAQVPLRDGSDFRVHGAMLRDNGQYHCKADNESCCSVVSNTVEIQVQELFPHPQLTASPSQPTDGSPVNLTCETRLPPQRSDVQLQFCFFREGQALGSGCSSSPELQILAMRSEDTGSYWCQAQTVTLSVSKKSLRSYIHVRRAVPSVQIHTRPPQGSVFEGQELVLVCSVRGVPGPISVSWYRRSKVRVATEIALSRDAEFRIPTVKSSDAGKYYCEANSIPSTEVTIHMRVPASRPVLTLRAPGAQALVGDTVELHCKAQTGSPPILYRFYHDGVTLGNNSAPSGGGVSFNLSLTEEHSGNYSCEADNGVGTQRSEVVTLSITGLTGSRGGHVATGVTGVLLSLVGLAAVLLLFYYWLPGRAGGRPACDASSSSSHSDPQEPTYHNVPAWLEMQPVYSNVNPKGGDVVYSEVCHVQGRNKRAAAPTARLPEDKDSSVIYSQVKVYTPGSRSQLSASSAPHR
ncbi:Fc receptor like 5 [Rhinolophus ferrumequinum]|uniref:Fc receptor like 5 n=1 Tax=Rhinolophus ferrumequinum TaxID=59479 RepID=A0A7J7SWL5_RHIFE|nr:Fc receptor like 5 [Rhinolophus ferrumequinum]